MNARTDESSLLATQWTGYADRHLDRTNLLLHALSVPAFMAGSVVVGLGPFFGPWWLAAIGVFTMAVSIASQGRGHRREKPPTPFRSPFDAVARLTVEQWVTFPRYVFTGGFRRAWMLSARTEARMPPQ
ncbi:MAG: terminase [Nannocystaceae bacterium]|nr:terminase [Nannocystaceae bacterium]